MEGRNSANWIINSFAKAVHFPFGHKVKTSKAFNWAVTELKMLLSKATRHDLCAISPTAPCHA